MLVPFNKLKTTTSSSPERIAVFGSTGSIGVSALWVIGENPELFSVFCLVANSNVDLLIEQSKKFRPEVVGLADENKAGSLRAGLKAAGLICEVVVGNDEISKLAADSRYDCLLAAVVGSAGLNGVFNALSAGKKVALANKESLVCGGELIAKLIAQKGGSIIPVDSEHSALFQALAGNAREDVSRFILTASGGPFLSTPVADFPKITPELALRHPKWNMGKKISIDSATMFNKALELIEAHWLFEANEDEIQVAVHPQSIVHSLVEYKDGSQIAQLSVPDMRGAISYALRYPYGRVAKAIRSLDLIEAQKLEFFALDDDKFPAVSVAREVVKKGGGAGTIFNCANEVAVAQFLQGSILFTDIHKVVVQSLEKFPDTKVQSLSDIKELEGEVRRFINSRK